MDKQCFFLLGVHNHQPVGNFESVIEQEYARAYRPFLEVLERHPRVRVTMHLSGSLFDTLLIRHPDYIERLRELGRRGQVEFMTGGYYEPILASIPDRDKIGQIEKMNDTVERYLGQRPVGLWLAERVWEPHLAGPLVRAGVRYCVLDETHFRLAGLSERDCLGYYLTEEEGQPLALFPILEKLRYTIPFADPERTFDTLRGLAREDGPPPLASIIDDGEKFGGWPGTHKLCYEEGWLGRFFHLLEARAGEFPTILFREALTLSEPAGRIYLPTASYFEMMEWSLPPAAAHRLDQARDLLRERGIPDAEHMLFRPGFWRNFLVKYPESNEIHKKMLHVSRRVSEALATAPLDQALHGAREFLWRGQCNCAYWHGLFGGLYLNHLRHELHRSLNIANRLWGESLFGDRPWLRIERLDFDADGREETLIETDRWLFIAAPAAGGVLLEVNYKPRDLNLPNTLARREEAYHDQVDRALVEPVPGEERASRTLTGQYQAKEAGLAHLLCYDRYRRLFGIDHVLSPAATLDDFLHVRHEELGDFVQGPFEAAGDWNGERAALTFTRAGSVRLDGEILPLSVRKTLTVHAGEDHFALHYLIRNDAARPLDLRWGVEFNVNLLAGDAPDRYPFVEGQEVHDRRLAGSEIHEEATAFGLIDEWMDLKVRFELSRPARLWRMGLETVSLSDGGLERNYQGTCLLPTWPLRLAPAEQAEWMITVTCGSQKSSSQ